ncbi:hypothetical protein AAY473_004968 [Plecturocebus cupreus]
MARRSGSCLYFQHFGRPRWANHLRPGVRDQPGQHGEIPSLLKNKKKNTKISRTWWHMPVIPATQETEAQESLEPGRQRLQGEIQPKLKGLGHGTSVFHGIFPVQRALMPTYASNYYLKIDDSNSSKSSEFQTLSPNFLSE